MEELLESIKQVDEIQGEELNKLIETILAYISKHGRLVEYSKISELILNKKTTLDVVDLIIANSSSILSGLNTFKVSCQDPKDLQIIDSCIDLMHSIHEQSKLEKHRKFQFIFWNEQFETNVKEIKDTKQIIDESINRYQDLHNVIKASERDTINKTVTVLGIFSAAVLGFFADLQILSGLLAAANTIHIYKLTFLASLCGIIIFNVLFLLLYSISKLSGTSIGSNTAEVSDRRLISKLFHKYPHVAIANIVFVIIMIVTIIVWFLRFTCSMLPMSPL